MRMGILGRGLQEYQLPYQRVLPLPIFTPAKVGAKEEREETPIQLQELLALETARRDLTTKPLYLELTVYYMLC